jgi:hypothetical protein
VTVAGFFCASDAQPTLAVSNSSECALASVMAVTAAIVSANGKTAFSGSMDLSSIPETSTPLYVCYSANGPNGPFIASAVGLVSIEAPKPVAVSPSVSVENCDLPNITVTGDFCTTAPTPTIGFSKDPACLLASLMAVTAVTVRPDGQSLFGVNVDLSNITNATNLYVCYSPTGPGGPFYPSNETVLTMLPSSISGITPNAVAAGCLYVTNVYRLQYSFLCLQRIRDNPPMRLGLRHDGPHVATVDLFGHETAGSNSLHSFPPPPRSADNVTVSGIFCALDALPTLAVSDSPSCALPSLMAVTGTTVSPDGTRAIAAAPMDFTTIPATSAPLYVCYSATGPSGPYISSSVMLFNVTAPKPALLEPAEGKTGCDIIRLTVKGSYCSDAVLPYLALSTSSTCAVGSLVTNASATVAADELSVTAAVIDISSIQNPTQVTFGVTLRNLWEPIDDERH